MSPLDNGTYTGPERRSDQRRKKSDRREDIRFEPGKDDRRQGKGRRKSDGDLWRQREE